MLKRLSILLVALVLTAPAAASAAKPAPTQTIKGTLIEWNVVAGMVHGTVVDANGQPHRFVMPPASQIKALDIGRVLRLQGRITRDMSGTSTFYAAKTATPLGLTDQVVVRQAAVSNVGEELVTLQAKSTEGMVNVDDIAYDPTFFSALEALRADATPLTHVFQLRLIYDQWNLADF
jgi:hypothetical protein